MAWQLLANWRQSWMRLKSELSCEFDEKWEQMNEYKLCQLIEILCFSLILPWRHRTWRPGPCNNLPYITLSAALLPALYRNVSLFIASMRYQPAFNRSIVPALTINTEQCWLDVLCAKPVVSTQTLCSVILWCNFALCYSTTSWIYTELTANVTKSTTSA